MPPEPHNVPVDTRTVPATRSTAAAVGALAVAAASLLGVAVSAALDARAPAESAGVTLAGGPGWPYALQGAVLAALAAAVLLRLPRQALGWSLAGFGVFWVLDGLAASWVRAGLTETSAWAGMTPALWFLNRFGAFLPVVAALLLLLFPTGRFLPGRMGVAGRVTLTVMTLAAGVVLVTPSWNHTGAAVVPPDVDLDPTTLAFVPAGAVPVAVAVGTAAFVVPMLTVVTRYRRSAGVDRDRMRWLLWAVIVMAVAMVLGVLVSEPWFDLVAAFFVMTLPATAMTVAVLAPGLAPIEELLPRTAVWAALALVLLGADLAAVALLGTALHGLDQTQVVAVVLLVSVLLYGPVRQRIRSWGRRLALGGRDDPYAAVAALAAALETTDDGPAQLRAVCTAVADAFGVAFVGIEVERARGERLVAAHGTRPAHVRTLPITYRDSEVGRLVLPARGLRSRLTPRDERLLADLVRQAATAARSWHLAAELQDHRERLVTAREEERRRIRRDLHDGLGPALSGLVFQLESARLLLDRDPGTARERVEATTAELREVVADVRRLVHDLRPPALDDRGLDGAVRQLAERVPGVAVDVVSRIPEGLPAAAEVAAYRIVAEALTNVARHARASRCTVSLCAEDGWLVVEVADDGTGIGPDVEVGVGLASLRERAAELGGRSEVRCPPAGGTLVRAALPLTPLVSPEARP